MWVALGLPAFWLGVRMTPRQFHAVAYPALLLSIFALALVLVPRIGELRHGARRWIDLGPLQFQPSEPAKLAFALWGAAILVRKGKLLRNWTHLLVPLVPVGVLLAALIMLEPD